MFANGSVTHTNSDANAWWHVDLGQVETIGTIKVWNRVEFPERLTNFYVFVSDVPFTSTNLTTTLNQAGVSSYQTSGQCGFSTELTINRTGRYVRVQLAGTNYLSIAEVQVWTGTTTPPVQWLISDHLGTPRMILDPTGSLANMKRHDYLPFGAELVAPTSGRSTAQGYAGGDGVRQQFTQKERDSETGLDYFLARYYSSIQGRFTSADSVGGVRANPQSLNLYAYVQNNPLSFVDPSGHYAEDPTDPDRKGGVYIDPVKNHNRDPLRFHYLGQNPTPVVTGDYTSGWRLFKKVLGLFKSHTPGGDAKTARFYAEQWAKEHPGAEFDPNKYTDEQILHAFRNGAFSKTAGDGLDPLQLLGIITVFRGGPTLVARPGVDIKIDKTTGLVQPGRGVSVSSDAAGLQRFGGAYKVESIPDELELIQRGQNLNHFEIAPRQAMTPQRYQELLNQVKLTRVPE